jgi:hypothetical protein
MSNNLSDFSNYISKVSDHANIRIREYHFDNGYGIIVFIGPKEYRTQLIIRKVNSWECLSRYSYNFITKSENKVAKLLNSVKSINEDL